ncbi:MAG: tryptophan--tRNA ligase [bacterium]
MNIFSGIQSSGKLHIGNYFGMMKRMIEYQEKETLFCFIANMHALTTIFNPKELEQNTFNAACDFLALGINPNKACFWVQSDVPEVTELAWLLSNVTSMGLLERAHSYKDKIAKGIAANHGLFAYPILMAADILMFGSDKVPVGKDQKQHIEMTRDIAIRFNQTYNNIFKIPEPDILEQVAVIPGIDGQKMSKSYGNTIDIFCTYEELKKKVMSIVSSSTPIDQPKNPETCTIFSIYSNFLNAEQKQALRERYLTPGLRYGDVKKELLDVIWNYFQPYREKREQLAQNPDEVRAIMKIGADKARAVGYTYLEKARKAVGITY